MSTPRWPLGESMPEIGPDVDALVLVFGREETERLRLRRGADDLMTLVEDDPRDHEPVNHPTAKAGGLKSESFASPG